jgi:hypothetical protein
MSVGAAVETRIAVATAAPLPAASSKPATTVQPPTTVVQPSPFAQLLRGLGREVSHGEAVMRGALGVSRAGGTLDAAELIALQAGVYRYSEAVDLAAKLIDHATTGLKTIVQGQ